MVEFVKNAIKYLTDGECDVTLNVTKVTDRTVILNSVEVEYVSQEKNENEKGE